MSYSQPGVGAPWLNYPGGIEAWLADQQLRQAQMGGTPYSGFVMNNPGVGPGVTPNAPGAGLAAGGRAEQMDEGGNFAGSQYANYFGPDQTFTGPGGETWFSAHPIGGGGMAPAGVGAGGSPQGGQLPPGGDTKQQRTGPRSGADFGRSNGVPPMNDTTLDGPDRVGGNVSGQVQSFADYLQKKYGGGGQQPGPKPAEYGYNGG